jgi:lipopolysaccharide/colanic/teichoic acid biosynthesis glycosyltransferase
MKRFFDILFSLLALIVFLPFAIPVILILRFTGEKEIFYIQERVGRYGKNFGLLKFATMIKNSSSLPGGDITMANDPRVLPFGKFLRKTKLNEVPQLVNILKGDISVVGPRPLTPKTFAFYPDHVQAALRDVKPGLTGVGSIVFRDEERIMSLSSVNHTDFYRDYISPYKGELELWFKLHDSLFNYFLIIAVTAWVVFFPQSRIVWKIAKHLPEPPEQLKGLI